MKNRTSISLLMILILFFLTSCAVDQVSIPKEILDSNIYMNQRIDDLKEELPLQYADSIGAYIYYDKNKLSYYPKLVIYTKYGRVNRLVFSRTIQNNEYSEDIEYVKKILNEYLGQGESSNEKVSYLCRYDLNKILIEWENGCHVKYSVIPYDDFLQLRQQTQIGLDIAILEFSM